jgi:type I restriction enzyme, S subunit
MSASDTHHANQTRTYNRASSVVFLKTDAPFGGLSNMAGGFPLRVNGICIRTSEALYQACRFPHRPEVQTLIIEQTSPMTAKMKGKPHRHDSRPDWDQVRIKIMRWCLRVKLAQNWRKFSALLLETGDRPIVEESRKDDFWGAKANVDGRTLVGMNVLGRLLMELRELVRLEGRESLVHVKPLTIPNFLLGGRPIGDVESHAPERNAEPRTEAVASGRGDAGVQPSLFDENFVREGPAAPYATNRARIVCVPELKPYTELKESGVAWLGRVPGHWNVLPNRALFAEINDRDHPEEQMLSVTITRGIVQQRTLLEGSSKKDGSRQDKSAYKLVQPNDIAYNKMRAWQGAIAASSYRGIISPAYIVQRLRDGDNFSAYFNHLFRTPQFAEEAERWSYGITSDMWSLRAEHFKLIYSTVPPPDEQAAIVRFLDWANGRLERAIRAKRKVIALLNEQKQAIIHRAVTRGLDPDVPLKPSGIAWLGDIPQHWEVWRVSRFARVGNGSTPSRAQPRYWNGGSYPWLNSSQINRGYIDSADQFVTRAALRECHLPKVPAGSVLVAITGQGKTRGTSALLATEATINQHVAYITPRVLVVSPEFLHLSLTAAYPQLRAISDDSGSTKGALTCEDIKRFKLPIPPREEQDALLSCVRAETRTIDATTAQLEKEIELLREYRTRLVADVVTGKLDVREAAARLPDEAVPDVVEDDAEIAEELDSEAEDAVA